MKCFIVERDNCFTIHYKYKDNSPFLAIDKKDMNNFIKDLGVCYNNIKKAKSDTKNINNKL